MAKSKRNNSVLLHGYLDLEAGTITEIVEKKNQDPEEYVYDYKSLVSHFDGKQIAISIRETTELESV
jgi:YonK protein